MWFGYNCLIVFCHFFYIVNYQESFFTRSIYTMGASCECNSSYSSFVSVVLKLYLFLLFCFFFFHGIRMCMWFGYNC